MSWHAPVLLLGMLHDRVANRRRAPATSRRMAGLLASLGPTFVKGAQLLSTRRDLLTPGWCDALGQLHDRVAPMSTAQARRVLARAYPTTVPWPFQSFDWTSTAAGSIACVYRARLHDGQQVAVKVRRPGIAWRMHADLVLLGTGTSVLRRLPLLRGVPVDRMVTQVGSAVLGQLDLTRESAALSDLRRNLASVDRFHVPEPLPRLSTREVLVMTLVEPLDRLPGGPHDNETRREIVRRLLHGVYRMLFVDGLVHCDMHPGNLYLTSGCTLVLLDAGFVTTLSPTVRQLFAEFFLNLALGRADECAAVVLRSAEDVPGDADLDRFRRGVADLVRGAHHRTAGQFRLAPFAGRLFDLQRRSRIAAAPEFVFPLLSLLVLEGVINSLDADVDFQREAIPTLLAALRPGS